MRVKTTRFGVLDVDDRSIVNMPEGLIGFEDRTQFCLIQHRPDTSFRWLQSVIDPALAFVVVDPADFLLDYGFEISDADAEALGLEREQDASILVILTISEGGKLVTANLAAPIVVNSNTMRGMQIALQDERYCPRHAIMTKEQRVAVENTLSKAA